MNSINVVSLNASINNGDVEKRYHEFANYCQENSPDLIAVQEVSLDVGNKKLFDLSKQLGPEYNYRYEAAYPGQEDSQGVAVISRFPIKHSHKTNFGEGKNELQIVDIKIGANKLALANTHLEAFPWQEVTRTRKMTKLSEYLNLEYEDQPQLIAGDHNSMPWQRCIRTIKRLGFVSIFEAQTGEEPPYTFPAPIETQDLLNGRYLKPKEVVALKAAAHMLPWTIKGLADIPHYTVDYVFTRGCTSANAQLFNGDAEHIMSDHLGVTADILLT